MCVELNRRILLCLISYGIPTTPPLLYGLFRGCFLLGILLLMFSGGPNASKKVSYDPLNSTTKVNPMICFVDLLFAGILLLVALFHVLWRAQPSLCRRLRLTPIERRVRWS